MIKPDLKLHCPHCHQTNTMVHGWPTNPPARRVAGLFENYYIMAKRYKCLDCEAASKWKKWKFNNKRILVEITKVNIHSADLKYFDSDVGTNLGSYNVESVLMFDLKDLKLTPIEWNDHDQSSQPLECSCLQVLHRRTRVKLDPFHAMDRVIKRIPRNHAFANQHCKALRDAIFLYNQDDLDKVKCGNKANLNVR
jgi:hypothetical protein